MAKIKVCGGNIYYDKKTKQHYKKTKLGTEPLSSWEKASLKHFARGQKKRGL